MERGSVLDEITRLLNQHLPGGGLIRGPFAGVGGVHVPAIYRFRTIDVELEAPWAIAHPRTVQGDALRLPFGDQDSERGEPPPPSLCGLTSVYHESPTAACSTLSTKGFSSGSRNSVGSGQRSGRPSRHRSAAGPHHVRTFGYGARHDDGGRPCPTTLTSRLTT